jgi:translation initiation factor IF-3
LSAQWADGRAAFVRSGGGDREIERQVRVNERVRAREVRLIDENGAQLGIMSSRDALRIARERELDLIEVAPTSQPPVCRIMDYGKHKYEQAKRERETRKRQKSTEVRLLRMKPQIGEHDLGIKVRKVREMLSEGSKVRVTLRFRGREMRRPELGTALMDRIAKDLSEVALVEGHPRREGRMMSMMLAPKPGTIVAKAEKTESGKTDSGKKESGKKESATAEKEPKREEASSDVEKQVEQEPQRTQQWTEVANAEDGGETG